MHWILLCVGGGGFAQDCGSRTIGSQYSPQWTPNTTSSFYLNIDSAAPCSGHVTEVQIGYYTSPNEATVTSLVTHFAFYRDLSANSDSNVFTRVSDVYNVSRTLNANDGPGTTSFPISPRIYVEAGTVVGACVATPSSSPQTGALLVVSSGIEVGEATANDRLIVARCSGGDDVLPQSVSLKEGKENLFASVLHIYATVGKSRIT